MWFDKGRCRNGDQCRFAHGIEELRAATANTPQMLEEDDEGNFAGNPEVANIASVTKKGVEPQEPRKSQGKAKQVLNSTAKPFRSGDGTPNRQQQPARSAMNSNNEGLKLPFLGSDMERLEMEMMDASASDLAARLAAASVAPKPPAQKPGPEQTLYEPMKVLPTTGLMSGEGGALPLPTAATLDPNTSLTSGAFGASMPANMMGMPVLPGGMVPVLPPHLAPPQLPLPMAGLAEMNQMNQLLSRSAGGAATMPASATTSTEEPQMLAEQLSKMLEASQAQLNNLQVGMLAANIAHLSSQLSRFESQMRTGVAPPQLGVQSLEAMKLEALEVAKKNHEAALLDLYGPSSPCAALMEQMPQPGSAPSDAAKLDTDELVRLVARA
jgi:hypothetical protein